MKNDVFQKLIYQLVSKLLVFPIYKFVFRGCLIGRENIPQKDSFIVVSNHGSLLDPPLLGHALGRNISFMAKAELFKVPFLGFIIKACGAYPVKRGIADKNTIKTACKKLSNDNCLMRMVILPVCGLSVAVLYLKVDFTTMFLVILIINYIFAAAVYKFSTYQIGYMQKNYNPNFDAV